MSNRAHQSSAAYRRSHNSLTIAISAGSKGSSCMGMPKISPEALKSSVTSSSGSIDAGTRSNNPGNCGASATFAKLPTERYKTDLIRNMLHERLRSGEKELLRLLNLFLTLGFGFSHRKTK